MHNLSLLSRRSFIKTAGAAASAFTLASGIPDGRFVPGFPLVDFHVHVEDYFPIEAAMKLSKERNVKFGIVDHPGPGNRIRTNDDLERHIRKYRQYPVFIGLQPVYLGWSKDFSPDLLKQLDYVLMDPQTVPVGGRFLRIWQVETFIDDPEAFMSLYMEHNLRILTTEPIDIFGWPTSLPYSLARFYDRLWTKKRRAALIDAAKSHGKAFEINELARIPDEEFILMARKAGLKFAFGTDSRNANAGRFVYCLEMVRRCGLTKADMYVV
jgi:histidinol phosphatase-like PHP family hydrolase